MAAGNMFVPRMPQLQDPLEQYGRLVNLRTALQQQQLQAQEIQRGNLQLQDQQAMTQAMHDWDGSDMNDLPSLILKNGGSANAVFGMKNTILGYRKNLQAMTKDQLANEATKNDVIAQHIDNVKNLPLAQQPQAFEDAKADLVDRGYLDPRHAQTFTYQGPDQLDSLEKFYIGHTAAVDAAAKQAKAAADTAQANKTNAELAWYQQHGMAPGVSPETQQLGSFLQNNPGATPAQFPAYKAGQEAAARVPAEVQRDVAVAKATQPLKIQTAQAEGIARQMVQAAGESVYAQDPQNGNQFTFMSKKDALQRGLTMIPVTEKQVSEDVQLNNRLGDVQQKIARYQMSLGAPLSAKDRGAISAVLEDTGFKLGINGVHLPTDWGNRLIKSAAKAGLSTEGQNRLIAYFNARESLVGYNRVLSGSGRTNEKNLELQLDTLPSPIDPEDYGQAAIGQFRENLQIVGQGLPKIPGVKSPSEWEQGITGPQGNPQGGGFNGNSRHTGGGFWGNIPGAVVRQ